MKRQSKWVIVSAILWTVLIACTPVNRAQQPTDPKYTNSEVAPSLVTGAYNTTTILRLEKQADVQWQCADGNADCSKCVVERLPSEREKLSETEENTYEDIEVDGWTGEIFKYDWIWGEVHYDLKTTEVQNADGTVTVLQETPGNTIWCTTNDENELLECDLHIKKTTYRVWDYVLKGFCEGEGFNVARTLPKAASYKDIVNNKSLSFASDTAVFFEGRLVKKITGNNQEVYTNSCKVILNHEESPIDARCTP